MEFTLDPQEVFFIKTIEMYKIESLPTESTCIILQVIITAFLVYINKKIDKLYELSLSRIYDPNFYFIMNEVKNIINNIKTNLDQTTNSSNYNNKIKNLSLLTDLTLYKSLICYYKRAETLTTDNI